MAKGKNVCCLLCECMLCAARMSLSLSFCSLSMHLNEPIFYYGLRPLNKVISHYWWHRAWRHAAAAATACAYLRNWELAELTWKMEFSAASLLARAAASLSLRGDEMEILPSRRKCCCCVCVQTQGELMKSRPLSWFRRKCTRPARRWLTTVCAEERSPRLRA
jgi:hypothetical protein